MTDVTADPNDRSIRERLTDAINDPSHDRDALANLCQELVNDVAAFWDANPPVSAPAGKVQYADAAKAARRAYRKAATDPSALDEPEALDAAIAAGFGIAEQSGRRLAAAALRSLAPPGVLRVIDREVAARVAEGAAGITRHSSAVAALLDRLPAEGTPWTQAERDLVVETFGNLLDLFYPANAPVTEGNPDA